MSKTYVGHQIVPKASLVDMGGSVTSDEENDEEDDDNDADDLVSRVLFDPLPTEYVYEDIDSIYIAEHDQHTNALESKRR